MLRPDFERNPRLDFEFNRRIPYYILAGLVFLWLLSGIYIVGPDEQGVVRRFGRMVRVVGPGPHWHLPFPIEKVDVPKVTEVRRIEIGFRTVHPGPPARYVDVPEEALMLTGDENIVHCEVVVQYRIKDSPKYLFNVRGQRELVKDASEAALRQVIGRHKIDEVLTEKKSEIQQEIQKKLQELMDLYDAGISIVLVKFQDVRAPKEVDAAFKDVASAREDRERLVQEAEAYRNDVLPKARGQAEKMIKEAEAYKIERIQRAKGDVARFLAMLREYRRAKEVTKTRLYIETMERVLPRVKKYIVEGKGTLNLLPLEKVVRGGAR